MALRDVSERGDTEVETGAGIESMNIEEGTATEIEAMSEMTETDEGEIDHTRDRVQDHDRLAATTKDISAHAGIGLGVGMASGTDTEDTNTVMTVDHGLQKGGVDTDVTAGQGLHSGDISTSRAVEACLRWILTAENDKRKRLHMELQRVSLEDLGTPIEQLLDPSGLHRVSVQFRTGHSSSESCCHGSLFHELPLFHSDFR
jgi:hypothetical protein